MAIAIAMALYGCGGGGADAPTAAAPPFSISGTAATGFAVVDAAVSVSCASGSGTATTNASGSYTVNIADGRGPCVITVTKPATATAPAITLKSITSGTDKSQVVNVTPLTTALVQYIERLAGVINPAALLTDPAAKALLSDKTALNKRITEDFLPFIKVTLGVDIKNADFLSVLIVPATSTTAGSQSDQDLEAFKVVSVVIGEAGILALINTKAEADKVDKPMPLPTATPTSAPTAAPTATPTAAPTATPTAAPTATPTAASTATPTAAPTATPTAAPTATPTSAPTAAPTATPTAAPTVTPTSAPTAAPTAAPEPVIARQLDQTPGSTGAPTAWNAAGSQFTYHDDANVASYAAISNFGANDAIAFTSAAQGLVAVSSQGTNVTLTVNRNGVVSSIVLQNIITAGQVVFDVASFNALPVGNISYTGLVLPQTASLDSRGGTLTNPAAVDASLGSFTFTDDALLSSVVRITNFGAEDALRLSNTTASNVAVSSQSGNVSLVVNQGGTISSITLVNVVPSGGIVYDVASFNALPVGNVQFQ